jgi:hypothetical protein
MCSHFFSSNFQKKNKQTNMPLKTRAEKKKLEESIQAASVLVDSLFFTKSTILYKSACDSVLPSVLAEKLSKAFSLHK